jgi:hypothetical protein
MRASLRMTTRREMGHWVYPRVGPVFEYESLELQFIGQRLEPHTLFFRHLAGEKKRLPNSTGSTKREELRCEHATLFYRMRRARCRRRE